ncbi:calcium-binding protein, partial [Propionibacterium freudenreichii]|uniref:calcium-binding protein n=1 Tax=Propionibacterium freudenreichii TaxID=1744 RepID=UPI003855181E
AGLGSDTYLFGKGDGRDVIGAIDDPATGKVDTLLFKPGVAPTEVTFGTAPNPLSIYAWDGDALVIKIAGTTDQITIQDFLNTGD